MIEVEQERVRAAFSMALDRLLGAINDEGYWEGRLSSSALSTATAVSALALLSRSEDYQLVRAGLRWLFATQGADGGWGDTPDSPSNLSTSLLVRCAFSIATGLDKMQGQIRRLDEYIAKNAGDLPEDRIAAIEKIYGNDRTFAAPILMNCALANLVPWEKVPTLPFELAAFPPALYKMLRMQVVSYALPALIAVGMITESKNPSKNALQRMFREKVTAEVLAKLEKIQPSCGGFLEATPLTSFVAMSLIGISNLKEPAARKCLDFLRASIRQDGSWPIDSNLSVWMTTSAVNAITQAGLQSAIDTGKTAKWIQARQYKTLHPYTNAAPGGWGWTHLPGGVPDADDTAGAIFALTSLGKSEGVQDGVKWLLQMQNADGGWPTFCKGWGKLPFDASSPDITAHAMRALRAARQGPHAQKIARACEAGQCYLAKTQRKDGSWVPLWFGNQFTDGHTNPVLGTARVLLAYADLRISGRVQHQGVNYLLSAQNKEGGWGGAAGAPTSTEETALAVIALGRQAQTPEVTAAYERGLAHLVQRVEQGWLDHPTPIGLYFASLWYSEALYPIIWTVEALGADINRRNPKSEF